MKSLLVAIVLIVGQNTTERRIGSYELTYFAFYADLKSYFSRLEQFDRDLASEDLGQINNYIIKKNKELKLQLRILTLSTERSFNQKRPFAI
jgi:hypothetical protein